MKIIENRDGVATRQDLQHRQSREQLLGARARADDARPRAARIPNTATAPPQVQIVETTAADYYGSGYQDVQNRVPKIDNTLRRPRLGADGRHGRRAAADLRRVPRPGRRGARAGGVSAVEADVERDEPQRLALKVDVDTLRGTREGVPRLLELLRRHGVARDVPVQRSAPTTPAARSGACSARASSARCSRTSVVRHYGVRTLLYGTLLPGPDIGRRAGERACAACATKATRRGIHCWDHVRWQDGVAGADARMDAREMQRACDRYVDDLRRAAAHARRRRLADERPCAAADAAARLRLLLGRPRHASRTCRCGTPS